MGCCFRMWIAQAEFRRRKQAVLTIQSMLRCYIAMLRFSKLRGLLRLRAVAHNVMYLNRLQSWNASIRLMKTTAVAMYAKRLTMLMVTRRLVITNTVAQSAHCIRHTINDEVLRRARMKLSTLATLVHSHGRILFHRRCDRHIGTTQIVSSHKFIRTAGPDSIARPRDIEVTRDV